MSKKHVWAREGEWQPGPAPWYYDKKSQWIRDAEDLGVAKVYREALHDLSNARMIAKTPEMFELLERASRVLEMEGLGSTDLAEAIDSLLIELKEGE